ncbi:MAG: cation:proton antiporter [Pirellula sp.]|jgi:CPA2 family monovalent cation:H+ antiporter-2|nr:cation:proton antiporter [Pirellula sp.]
MHNDFALLLNLAASLVLALIFGLITEKLRLSPIVGYLLAGFMLGPQTPGMVADPKMAAELAEIGVVLLMFGVGLHFHLRELLSVRRIAIPGACGQILVATLLGAWLMIASGLGWRSGMVVGIAISVASTVVLIRMLMDNDIIHSPQGHIAVGWLIVEDIFTVLVLVALPAFAPAELVPDGEAVSLWYSLLLAVVKVSALALVVVGGGRFVIPWLLGLVASTRSRELFTLSILAIALAVATGSAFIFGVSMALGAFLAGMVVGQTEVSHQAAADALPMRDAFAVLFFVSVGMLFDPFVMIEHPVLFLGLLSIILIIKPLTAFLIVWFLRYSVRTAITVAIALAQIGEFSFLLAEEANRLELLSHEGHTLLVACALLSITINPLLFRCIAPLEAWLQKRPQLWQALLRRSEEKGSAHNQSVRSRLENSEAVVLQSKTAVIIGYGPVGRTASSILKKFGVQPIVIDLNLDTVREISDSGDLAVYGDATRRDILEAAGILQARYLLVTIPEMLVRTAVILTATDMNPEVRVFARARYLQEKAWLEELGTKGMVTEEGETAIGLAVLLLRELKADEGLLQEEIRRVQKEFSLGSHGAELASQENGASKKGTV